MEVEFHTRLAQPHDHLARLLRKALRQGSRLCVATPFIDEVSQYLWTAETGEFMAHARPGVQPAVWRRSALWLLPAFDPAQEDGTRPAVWINLGAPQPQQLRGCERLIELVSTDADAAQAARQRWKAYLAAGLAPVIKFEGT